MGVFIFRKFGAALIVVFLASVLVFVGVRAIPGDPALAYAAEERDAATLAAIREKYGLDEPLHVQYVTWIGLALRGDLGTDSRGLPVAETIVERPAADARARRARDADRGRRRDHGGRDRGRPTRETVGLRRDDGGAARPVRAALLARPAHDHRLLGEPRLAPGGRATSPSARTRSGTSSTCSCPRSSSASASPRC